MFNNINKKTSHECPNLSPIRSNSTLLLPKMAKKKKKKIEIYQKREIKPHLHEKTLSMLRSVR